MIMLSRKKEIIAETRKKHEDLEFQLMELETRCEAELEQAEEHFQTEQIIVTHNSKLRQVKSFLFSRLFFFLLKITKSLEYFTRS